MSTHGAYGQQLGEAFHMKAAPSFVTRGLKKTEIAVTQIRCDYANGELTAPVRCEDAFLAKLTVRDCARRVLWKDQKLTNAAPLKAGNVSIFDLRASWIGQRVSPFHTISFYLPRRALNAIADIEEMPRIDDFMMDSVRGVEDRTIMELGMTLLPAFERPHEANQLFIDHITTATAAHLLLAYGRRRKPAKVIQRPLTTAQERRVQELLTSSLDGEVSMAHLADACHLPVSSFTTAFVASFGMPPHRWLLTQRLRKAMELLGGVNADLDEVARRSGFADRRHLVRAFRQSVGTDPQTWLRAVKH